MKDTHPRNVENYVTPDGSDVFHGWLDALGDDRARVLIDKTIAKIRLGNLGDHKSVGGGVQEVRLDYGPGYRIYIGEHGNTLVIILCGSTKKRQQKTIDLAKGYWKDWKERKLL
ncbi:type II toxin-antitoxin system RelE/ParE family toxin [Bdellovibrionota bacterium FG-2]